MYTCTLHVNYILSFCKSTYRSICESSLGSARAEDRGPTDSGSSGGNDDGAPAARQLNPAEIEKTWARLVVQEGAILCSISGAFFSGWENLTTVPSV